MRVNCELGKEKGVVFGLCHVGCACMAGQKNLIKFFFCAFGGRWYGVFFARHFPPCVVSLAFSLAPSTLHFSLDLFFRLYPSMPITPTLHKWNNGRNLNQRCQSYEDSEQIIKFFAVESLEWHKRIRTLDHSTERYYITPQYLKLYFYLESQVSWHLVGGCNFLASCRRCQSQTLDLE